MTSKTSVNTPPPPASPSPLVAYPTRFRQAAFAKQNLHDFLSEPSQPDMTLFIYATTSKKDGMEIKLMGSTIKEEADRLIDKCKYLWFGVPVKDLESKDEERKKVAWKAQIGLAEKLLDDWVYYGPGTFGSTIVLVGGDEIRCLIRRRT